MRATATSIEPLLELKFGQVGIANLRLNANDPAALRDEIEQKVAAAPQLFRRAPVVLDLSRLPLLPDADETRALLDAVREAGMLPVGLSYSTSENERLAEQLNLPLFAKFRAAYDRPNSADRTDAQAVPPSTPPPESSKPRAVAVDAPASVSTLRHDKPVRSGQQVYARGRDLIVNASVANAAEVIADGSIHVYGRLSGRALAGAQGNSSARIYCLDFQAELVSIAGRYRVFEDLPPDLRGKPVQAWLDGERLLIEKLGA